MFEVFWGSSVGGRPEEGRDGIFPVGYFPKVAYSGWFLQIFDPSFIKPIIVIVVNRNANLPPHRLNIIRRKIALFWWKITVADQWTQRPHDSPGRKCE